MYLRYNIITLLVSLVAIGSQTTLQGSLARPKLKSTLQEVTFLDAPLEKWEPAIYDNPYQGAPKELSQDIMQFLTAIKVARTATRKKAETEHWGDSIRVTLDWVYTLVKTFEGGYVSKPFVKWTVKDLNIIRAWIQRTQVDDPNAYRANITAWHLAKTNERGRKLVYRKHVQLMSQEEREALLAKDQTVLQEYPRLLEPLTHEEEQILHDAAFFFCKPEEVEQELAAALKTAQESLRNIKHKSFKEKQDDIITIGARLHYDIVRIHPSEEGNKRLSRLCMFILFMQHGIRPRPIDDVPSYLLTLIHSLKQGSSKPFERFIREVLTTGKGPLEDLCHRIQAKLKQGSSIDNFTEELAGQLSTKLGATRQEIEGLFTTLSFLKYLGVPMPKAPVRQQSQPTQQPQTAKKCANCKKDNASKCCGRCKKVNYCDRECQKLHWKSHKSNCKK